MRIVLKVHKIPEREDLAGMVRLTPAVERAVRNLQAETGLSARKIASTLILQATEYVQIEEV